MADSIPYVVTEGGGQADAPSGAIPIALYGNPIDPSVILVGGIPLTEILTDLNNRVEALEGAGA